MSDDLTECVADTLADAEAAHDSLASLLEMLGGCPPGHNLTAANLRQLIALVQYHMDNVVEGLRVVESSGAAA